MSALDKVYSTEFYESIRGGSQESSRQIVPIVVDTVQPHSVVDVGCGDGTWLRAFIDQGIDKVLGIDGDYVDPADLQISRDLFVSHDLSNPSSIPSTLGKFDLAVSLEVAEHLPLESAEPFVSLLTGLAPVVLFSAAVPGQGGSNHLNEQWQDYWADLFANRDYRAVDCIRKQIWLNGSVQYWYRQNLVLYASNTYRAQSGKLRDLLAQPAENVLPLIHPEFYMSVARELAYRSQPPSVGKLCNALPGAVGRAISHRFGRNKTPYR